MVAQITDHEVLDHGFMLPDYFSGCGVAFTDFDDVATGCGMSRYEAYEDALEQLAQNGWTVESLPAAKEVGQNAMVPDECNDDGGNGDSVLWYVSIRVRA
jgi:hypothetical protein